MKSLLRNSLLVILASSAHGLLTSHSQLSVPSRDLAVTSSSSSASFSFYAGRHTTTFLFMNTPNTDDEARSSNNKPSVRFSDSTSATFGASSSSSSQATTSTLDSILVWIISDTGSIVLGCVGLVLLLVGRLSFSTEATATTSTADITTALGEETRFNLLAALACCAVLVNGLSKLDVTTALAETVDLMGVKLRQPVVMTTSSSQNNNDVNKDSEWEWLLQAALVATPAESAILLQETTTTTPTSDSSWTITGVGGVLSPTLASALQSQESPQPVLLPESSTPVVDRFLSNNNKDSSIGESYLPTLQALPGRKEFAFYLPNNTQAVLLVPLSMMPAEGETTTRGGVLVLGANQARSFTPRDIAWCQAAAKRVG